MLDPKLDFAESWGREVTGEIYSSAKLVKTDFGL